MRQHIAARLEPQEVNAGREAAARCGRSSPFEVCGAGREATLGECANLAPAGVVDGQGRPRPWVGENKADRGTFSEGIREDREADGHLFRSRRLTLRVHRGGDRELEEAGTDRACEQNVMGGGVVDGVHSIRR